MEPKLIIAEQAYKSGDYQKAFELYCEVPETINFTLHIKQQKANCLMMLKEYEQSSIINLDMVRLYPTNAIGYANYALNLYYQGHGMEGISFLNTALKTVEFEDEHREIVKDAILQIESRMIFGEKSEESNFHIKFLSHLHIINLKNIISSSGFPLEDFKFGVWPSLKSEKINRLNITYKDDEECIFTFTTENSTLYYSPTSEGVMGSPVYSQFSYINFELLKEHFNTWLHAIYF